MDWSTGYLACFVLGLTFVGLSALAGHLGGGAHGGHGPGDHGAAGHDPDASSDGAAIPLPLLSPLVLSIFVGMFGAGGLLLIKGLGLTSPLLHVPGAAATSLASGFGVAWTMMKVMRHAESNSLASHADVLGREVEVTLSIRSGEPGEIAYEAGGTRQTLPALSDGQTRYAQGERVRVLEVVDGVARVGPLTPDLSQPPSLPVGIPVERERTR